MDSKLENKRKYLFEIHLNLIVFQSIGGMFGQYGGYEGYGGGLNISLLLF